MGTAQHVHQLGLYTSACCESEKLFLRGDRLSRCPRCSQQCAWTLAEPVLTWQEFEALHSTLELEPLAA